MSAAAAYPAVPLGELLTQVRDVVAVRPDETYRPAGIRSFGKGLFARPPIEGGETKYGTLNRLRQGQFVYSRLFGWEGALATVPQSFEGRHVSHEFPTFDIDTGKLDVGYLGWLCRWNGLWESLRSSTTGLGLRRQRVPVDRLLATPIPLPTLREQRRLCVRLSAVIGRGEAVQRLNRRAAELRGALTSSTFHQLVDADRPVPLGEVLTQVHDEVTVEPTGAYRPAGIKSFGKGLFARPPISGADTKYKKFNRLRGGRFVYSRLFGWEGALATVPASFEGFDVSHEFPTFDIDDGELDVEYLTWLCRWDGLWEALSDTTTGLGLRRQRVPVDRLLQTPIPLPSLPEQRRLGAIGAALAEAEQRAGAMDRLLEALVPSAIGAALRGEL